MWTMPRQTVFGNGETLIDREAGGFDQTMPRQTAWERENGEMIINIEVCGLEVDDALDRRCLGKAVIRDACKYGCWWF